MVLQDLGRRINAAVNDMTRSNNLDEKVCLASRDDIGFYANLYRHSMTCLKRFVLRCYPPT